MNILPIANQRPLPVKRLSDVRLEGLQNSSLIMSKELPLTAGSVLITNLIQLNSSLTPESRISLKTALRASRASTAAGDIAALIRKIEQKDGPFAALLSQLQVWLDAVNRETDVITKSLNSVISARSLNEANQAKDEAQQAAINADKIANKAEEATKNNPDESVQAYYDAIQQGIDHAVASAILVEIIVSEKTAKNEKDKTVQADSNIKAQASANAADQAASLAERRLQNIQDIANKAQQKSVIALIKQAKSSTENAGNSANTAQDIADYIQKKERAKQHWDSKIAILTPAALRDYIKPQLIPIRDFGISVDTHGSLLTDVARVRDARGSAYHQSALNAAQIRANLAARQIQKTADLLPRNAEVQDFNNSVQALIRALNNQNAKTKKAVEDEAHKRITLLLNQIEASFQIVKKEEKATEEANTSTEAEQHAKAAEAAAKHIKFYHLYSNDLIKDLPDTEKLMLSNKVKKLLADTAECAERANAIAKERMGALKSAKALLKDAQTCEEKALTAIDLQEELSLKNHRFANRKLTTIKDINEKIRVKKEEFLEATTEDDKEHLLNLIKALQKRASVAARHIHNEATQYPDDFVLQNISKQAQALADSIRNQLAETLKTAADRAHEQEQKKTKPKLEQIKTDLKAEKEETSEEADSSDEAHQHEEEAAAAAVPAEIAHQIFDELTEELTEQEKADLKEEVEKIPVVNLANENEATLEKAKSQLANIQACEKEAEAEKENTEAASQSDAENSIETAQNHTANANRAADAAEATVATMEQNVATSTDPELKAMVEEARNSAEKARTSAKAAQKVTSALQIKGLVSSNQKISREKLVSLRKMLNTDLKKRDKASLGFETSRDLLHQNTLLESMRQRAQTMLRIVKTQLIFHPTDDVLKALYNEAQDLTNKINEQVDEILKTAADRFHENRQKKINNKLAQIKACLQLTELEEKAVEEADTADEARQHVQNANAAAERARINHQAFEELTEELTEQEKADLKEEAQKLLAQVLTHATRAQEIADARTEAEVEQEPADLPPISQEATRLKPKFVYKTDGLETATPLKVAQQKLKELKRAKVRIKLLKKDLMQAQAKRQGQDLESTDMEKQPTKEESREFFLELIDSEVKVGEEKANRIHTTSCENEDNAKIQAINSEAETILDNILDEQKLAAKIAATQAAKRGVEVTDANTDSIFQSLAEKLEKLKAAEKQTQQQKQQAKAATSLAGAMKSTDQALEILEEAVKVLKEMETEGENSGSLKIQKLLLDAKTIFKKIKLNVEKINRLSSIRLIVSLKEQQGDAYPTKKDEPSDDDPGAEAAGALVTRTDAERVLKTQDTVDAKQQKDNEEKAALKKILTEKKAVKMTKQDAPDSTDLESKEEKEGFLRAVINKGTSTKGADQRLHKKTSLKQSNWYKEYIQSHELISEKAESAPETADDINIERFELQTAVRIEVEQTEVAEIEETQGAIRGQTEEEAMSLALEQRWQLLTQAISMHMGRSGARVDGARVKSYSKNLMRPELRALNLDLKLKLDAQPTNLPGGIIPFNLRQWIREFCQSVNVGTLQNMTTSTLSSEQMQQYQKLTPDEKKVYLYEKNKAKAISCLIQWFLHQTNLQDSGINLNHLCAALEANADLLFALLLAEIALKKEAA